MLVTRLDLSNVSSDLFASNALKGCCEAGYTSHTSHTSQTYLRYVRDVVGPPYTTSRYTQMVWVWGYIPKGCIPNPP